MEGIPTSEEASGKQRYIGDIIKHNFYDQIVIIGHPYDQSARRRGMKTGSYLGPDSFRRFLNSGTAFGALKNAEYGIDIEEGLGSISDYGNIQIEQVTDFSKPISEENMKLLDEKLALKTKLCLQRDNSAFIIGGTKDLNPMIVKAYHDWLAELDTSGEKASETNEVVIVIFTADSTYTKSIQESVQTVPDDFRAKLHVKIVKQFADQDFNAQTLIEELKAKENCKIHLAIDLESIVEADGVTTLKSEMAVSSMFSGYSIAVFIQEVATLLGRNRISGISLTDYNPIVEDQRTGRMLAQFFYRLCLGIAMHNLAKKEK